MVSGAGPVRVGVTLPQFRADAETAISAARRAEELGLDGVFVFDHLWPMGSPGRPIIASVPLLGALAAETSRIHLGTLVMRVGLRPDALLLDELACIWEMSAGRLVAGLGTGDRLSAEENLSYGVSYPPAAERRRSLEECARVLGSWGVPVWIGAGARVAPGTRDVAVRTNAALNLWDTEPDALQAEREVELTWGGPVSGDAAAIGSRIGQLAGAGATWVVCAWPDSLEDVAEAARRVARGAA